jgi:hypothetical protein
MIGIVDGVSIARHSSVCCSPRATARDHAEAARFLADIMGFGCSRLPAGTDASNRYESTTRSHWTS